MGAIAKRTGDDADLVKFEAWRKKERRRRRVVAVLIISLLGNVGLGALYWRAAARVRELDGVLSRVAILLQAANAEAFASDAPGSLDAPAGAAPLDVLTVTELRCKNMAGNQMLGRISWSAEIQNTSMFDQTCKITVWLLDEAGFVIETDYEYGIVVTGHGTATVRGSVLTTPSSASSVVGCECRLEWD